VREQRRLTAKDRIQNQHARKRPALKSNYPYHPKPIYRGTTTTRPNAHTNNECAVPNSGSTAKFHNTSKSQNRVISHMDRAFLTS
ncbi:MAG: hypothetical protein WB489_22255, partial [Pseudolabrys sp.]